MATAQVPEHLPDTITLSDTVHIDFTPGAGGISWATLHTARMATEIGSARTPDDIDNLLTMAAGVLLEHPTSVTRAFADKETGERWVLVGPWVLSARLGHDHIHCGTADAAATHFSRLVGGRL